MYGVSGEVCWCEGEGCGERNEGSVLGCGAPTHFLPHFPTSPSSPHSPHLPLHLPLLPPHVNTLSYTSTPPLIYTSFHISSSFPHIPTHFPPPIPTSPSPSQSVAKLPCDEVSVAKLLATTHFPTLPISSPTVWIMWRSYHVMMLP